MDEGKRGLQEDIKAFKKLAKLNKEDEFNAYFDLLLRTVAAKMMWAFTTGKDGDNVKNWEDFCKVRGEITAYLYPIQEIRGAEGMVAYLQEQLDNHYNNSQ